MSYRLSTSSTQANPQVEFFWQGKKLTATQGEKLSTVLLANGIKTVGRSFKYGRPRGILAYGVEEPNALVTLEPNTAYQIPNVRATEVLVYEGMRAISATVHPSVNFDWRLLFKPIHRFMPAGFYYKTFKFPRGLRAFYTKFIRQMAGFSRHNATLEDKESYLKQYLYGDVLVVGAGISGCQMALQLSLADSHLRIILCEQSAEVGGETLAEIGQDEQAREKLEQLRQAIEQQQNIQLFTQTTVFGFYEGGLSQALQKIQTHVPIQERKSTAVQKLLHIRTTKRVMATGALERPLLFKNNDLPGVMLVSAVRRYLVNDGVAFASSPVIIGNNDSIYSLVKDLQQQQIKTKVVDLRQQDSIGEVWIEYCKAHQITHYIGYAPIVAHASGYGKNYGCCDIEIAPVQWRSTATGSIEWVVTGDAEKIMTDGIAVSGGFNPVLHLAAHSGNKPIFNELLHSYLPAENDEVFYCGSLCGLSSWGDCVYDADRKSQQLLAQGKKVAIKPIALQATSPIFYLPEQKSAFVDLQTDVKVSDIRLSIRENYRSMEHIKRYTATGFGTDQGKTSNINAIAVAANTLRQSMGELATTTFRPPYTAVTFGAMAASHQHDLFDARRYSVIHPAHCARHPVWELVGQWYRPRYYPQANESMQQAIRRECLSVRQTLAMMDVSTLGKIEVYGRDAREFLSRIYTNSWLKIPPGHCRYGVMCDERGMIMDDGVSACIDEHHFYMTTTTGGAGRVYEWMELWLQTEWQDLDVILNSVTDQWATVAVVGPKSRAFMQSVEGSIDFSTESFPFMQWREGRWGDFDVRIMRISFSGELSYEINVSADQGLELWQSIERLAKEKEYDITPYGTEAMHVLRAEKGFIIVGQDTDGSHTPQDMGMHWIVKTNEKMSFIGERSQQRSDMLGEKRKQLVGLLTVENSQHILTEGLAIIRTNQESPSSSVSTIPINPVIGHVTSSYYSPILEHSIALAVVENGHHIDGQRVNVREKDGSLTPVKVCAPIFYDSDNTVIKG